ncbi:hypothetical protein [Massilia aerilata]|uniref:XRE family transcriptional regulator n=1 Tax=Massilia aerilata TaxID=453817 RepID=A0ABW0S1M0_9BURK
MYKFMPKAVEEDNPHYDPDTLLDTLTRLLGARNDRHLARLLSVQPSQICKVRKRRVSVAPALLISMHEETGLSLRQLRALMGDYREHSGASAKHPTLPQLQYLKGLRPLQTHQAGATRSTRIAA